MAIPTLGYYLPCLIILKISGKLFIPPIPSKKLTMLIKNWKSFINRFMIEFEDRIADYV